MSDPVQGSDCFCKDKMYAVYTRYGFKILRMPSMSDSFAWMFKSIGLDKSRLKIPMIDFASMTYLPDTRSKSLSNFVISFTNDFTLLIEFKEICTVFIKCLLIVFLIHYHIIGTNNKCQGNV